MGGIAIPRSIPPSGLLRSIAGSDYHEYSLLGYASRCGARYSRRTRHLTTPVDNSLNDPLEIVTIHDPTHPLYGKRFLVASRPSRPDAQGTYLLVFLRDTVQLRLPLSVTLPEATEQVVTKLTLEAVADVIAIAQASGLWQSSPQSCGDASRRHSNRPSRPISQPS